MNKYIRQKLDEIDNPAIVAVFREILEVMEIDDMALQQELEAIKNRLYKAEQSIETLERISAPMAEEQAKKERLASARKEVEAAEAALAQARAKLARGGEEEGYW